MDAEKLVGSLSPTEIAEVAAALPTQLMLDELVRRNPAKPAAVGATAIANHGAELATVPKIDTETTERLEALPADYRELVVTRYAERYTAVDGYIREGKLSEAYRLPELGSLMGRIVAIAPAHEAIEASGGQPEFDFVPQGLSLEQWSGLLKGHRLPDGEISNGAYRYHSIDKVTDPTKPRQDTNRWDVAVMDVSPEPAVRGISADGSKAAKDYNLKKSLKALEEASQAIGMPVRINTNCDLSPNELLIKQISPSEDMKFAIQLGRLERREQPIDSNNIWTIGKENVKVGRELNSVFSYFNSSSGRVVSARGFARDSDVVRLSARGRDFIPQA
ncbi:MAG: hypothetical protein AAB971_02370 [Patescibacteria group bacterium]